MKRTLLAFFAALSLVSAATAAEVWNPTTVAYSSLASLAGQTGLRVYRLTEADAATNGVELTSGIYYLDRDLTFTGKASVTNTLPGGNGLRIATNSTVYIYIPAGRTLTATGGKGADATDGEDAKDGNLQTDRSTNTVDGITFEIYSRRCNASLTDIPDVGIGASGGGAAIMVPTNANLTVFGVGNLSATGGAGGEGRDGGRGGATACVVGSWYALDGARVLSKQYSNSREGNQGLPVSFTGGDYVPYVRIMDEDATATRNAVMNYCNVDIGNGGSGGGGAGGGGAGIGSDGTAGGAGSIGGISTNYWQQGNGTWFSTNGTVFVKNEEVHAVNGMETVAQAAVPCGQIRIMLPNVDGIKGGAGGSPSRTKGRSPERYFEIGDIPLFCPTNVPSELEPTAIHGGVLATVNESIFGRSGQYGGSGGAGGQGADVGTGGAGGAGGVGGDSGMFADKYFCLYVDGFDDVTKSRPGANGVAGVAGTNVTYAADYPYNNIAFVGAKDSETNAIYEITAGTKVTTPTVDEDGTVVGGWEVTAVATNLPPEMGGNDGSAGIGKIGTFFGAGAAIDTLGLYGNATLKKLLLIYDDPDAANVTKIYDALPTNINVTVTNAVPGLTKRYSTNPDDPSSWKDELKFVNVERTIGGEVTSNRVWYVLEAPGYITKTNSAWVTIIPRQATVTAGSAFKIYDGEPLSCGTWTTDNFVTGVAGHDDEGVVSATLPATITNAGSVSNDFSEIVYTSSTLMGNYSIATNVGVLAVKRIDGARVSVVANTNTVVYNAKEQSVEGLASVKMYTNGVEIAGKAFDSAWVTCARAQLAKGTNVGTYGMGLKNGDFSIVPDRAINYTNTVFEVTDGWLKITPKRIDDPSIVAEPPADVVYSGKEQKPTDVVVRDTSTTPATVLVQGKDADYEIVRYENNTNVTRAAKVFIEGRGNYGGSTNLAFAITPAKLTVTPTSFDLTYGDPAPAEYTYSISGYVPGEDIGVLTTRPVFTSDYVPRSVPGTYPIRCVVDAAAQNYEFDYAEASVTVKSATIKYEARKINVTYDGTNRYVKVNVEVPAEGATTEYSYDGGATWTNEVPAYCDATNDVTVTFRISAENYVTATGSVSVIIAPRPLVLRSADASRKYNGLPLVSTNVVADSFATGESLDYFNFYEGAVNVGVYRQAASFEYRENGTAKLSNYAVRTEFGDLTIEPSDAQIQIVSEDGEWVYDPALVPFSKHEYRVVNSNLFAEGDYPIVVFSDEAKIAGVGTVQNEFTYHVTNDLRGDVTAHYENLSTSVGALKVTPAAQPFAKQDYAGHYDGAAHGPTVTPAVDGAKVEYLNDRLFTDVTNATVRFVISKENYQTVTGEARVAISPISVEFESASTNKVYDMKPLTFGADGISTKFGGGVKGYPAGEGFEFSGFNSITEVGTAPASFAWTTNAATKACNYDVRTTFGTLTVITNDPQRVTLVAASATFPFDGDTHEKREFTARNLPAGCKIVDVRFSPASKIKYPGEVRNVILEAGIVNAEGQEVSRLYTLAYEPGTLKVTPIDMPAPKAEGVVTVYDGREHSITVTPAALLGGETATVTYSETGAAESFVTNNPAYVHVNRDGFRTYRVNFRVSANGYNDYDGEETVTITQRVISVVSEGYRREYDATPLVCHKADLATGSGTLAEGDGIGYTFPVSRTDVGKQRNEVGCTITNASGDVTFDYAIERTAGWLEVTPFELKVNYTANDKTYDGNTNATFGSATCDRTCPNGESVTFDPKGMEFYFETPEVDPGKPVHAVGYDEKKNLSFASGAKAENYKVTFDPASSASILLAEPPALDPDPSGEFKDGVGPFYDHNPPTTPPPAADPVGGEKLSNYDVVTCYDGNGHTFDTNGLFTAIATNDWIHGNYAVKYSTDAKDWKDWDGLNDSLVFTNVVSTSFWYRVIAPGDHANYSNYYHAVGLTITQRVVTVKADDKGKVYGEKDPALTCTTTNLVLGETMLSGRLGREPGEAWTPDGTFYAINAAEEFDAGSNYTVVFNPGKFTIRRKRADDGDVTVAKPDDVYYNGKAHKPTPDATDTREGMGKIDASEFEYSYENNVDAGKATVTLTFTNNYEGAISTNFTISPRSVTLTSESGEWTYDGEGHGTNEVKSTEYDGPTKGGGFVPGEGATYEVTGSVTNVADSAKENNAFTYSLSNAKNANYDILTVFGDLAIKPYRIDDDRARITAQPIEDRCYTGQAHEPKDEIVVSDAKTGKTLVQGTDYAITGYANNTNATDFANPAFVFLKGLGNYTNELSVAFAITQKVVRVIAEDKSVVYGDDAPTYTYKTEGFVSGETAISAGVTGEPVLSSAYEKGVTQANATLPIRVDVSGVSAMNYSFAPVDGTLTVTSATITYDARKIQETYDGTNRYVKVNVEVPAEGATTEYSYDGGATWTNEVPAYCDATNDVTVTFRISAENYVTATGSVSVIIAPRPLLLSTASMRKIYDGDPLTSTNVVAESYAPGELFGYVNFGSVTYPGSGKADFDVVEIGSAKFSNYKIEKNPGELVVLASEKQIQVVSESKEWTYDQDVAEYVWPVYDVANSNLFAEGDYPVVTFSPDAKLAGVGMAKNSFSVSVTNDLKGDVTAAYDGMLYSLFGNLTVKPAKFGLVKASGYVGYYDAKPHGVSIETDVRNAATNFISQSEFTDATNAVVRFELTAANYLAYTGEVDVVVRPVPVTFTSESRQKVFDGTTKLKVEAADITLTNDIASVGVPAGELFDYGEFAELDHVGQCEASFEVLPGNTKTRLSNYSITKRYGLLTMVEKGVLNVRAKSATFEFTGASFTNWEYEVVEPSPLREGHYVSNVVFDANSVVRYPSEGNVRNRILSFRVFEKSSVVRLYSSANNGGDGDRDVTSEYVCVPLEGRLCVTPLDRPDDELPIAENVITVYDGRSYSITVEPDPKKTYIGTPTVYYSETGEELSFVTNNPAYSDYDENPRKVHYRVSADGYTDVYGFATVTITQRVISVKSEDAGKVYDGTPLTETTQPFAPALADGDTLNCTFANSQTEVGLTENLFECAITNAAGRNMTFCYDIRKTVGWLEVTPCAVSVSFNAADKTYDGNTNAVSTSDGTSQALIGSESLTFVTNGMYFAFADPNVGAKTVTAYGFDETNNIVFAEGTRRGNYAVTFVPTTTATIIKAGPPPIDPDPEPGEPPFPPEVGPFTDEDLPPQDPPATTNENGEVRSLSNFDYVMPYDGFGHTLLTNELFESIESLDWLPETKVKRGDYGVTYSVDRKVWTGDLSSFTFTNVVSTSFWYKVETPAINANFSNYVHAVGVTITQRVSTVTFEAADKPFDGNTKATCTTTNFANTVTNAQGKEESFTLDTSAMTFLFNSPDAGTDKTVTAFGYSDDLVSAGPDTLKGNYSFNFVTNTHASILKQRIDDLTFVAETTNCVYNGEGHEPTPVVKDNFGTELPVDYYRTRYENNTNATAFAFAEVTLTNGNYTGVLTNFFTIFPRPVSVYSDDDIKVYDGTSLTNHNWSVAPGLNFVGDDVVGVKFTGTITDVGTTNNEFEVVFKNETAKNNYDLSYDFGILKVTPRPITPVIPPMPGVDPPTPPTPPTPTERPYVEADSVVKVYDGIPTNIVAVVTGMCDDAKVDFKYSTSETGPFVPWNELQFTNVEYEVGGQCVLTQKVWYSAISTDNYIATTNHGWLAINPKPVTVTAVSQEWEWDGYEHSATGYVPTAEFVGSDGIESVTMTPESVIRDIGSVSNEIDKINFTSGTITGNYVIVKAYGVLSVIERMEAMLDARMDWFFDYGIGLYLPQLYVACTNNCIDRLQKVYLVVKDRMMTSQPTVTDIALWNYYGSRAVDDYWLKNDEIYRYVALTNKIVALEPGSELPQICGPTVDMKDKWLSMSAIDKRSIRMSNPQILYRTRSPNVTSDFEGVDSLFYLVWECSNGQGNVRRRWLPIVPWTIYGAERNKLEGGKKTTVASWTRQMDCYGWKFDSSYEVLTPSAANLVLAAGLPTSVNASSVSCALTAFSIGDGLISGRVETSSGSTSGVPSAYASVQLLGAKTLSDGFRVIGTIETDKDGNFETAQPTDANFFKVNVDAATQYFK